MARDDQRMHGHNTPGLVPGRGHERHETPVRLDGSEPGGEADRPSGSGAGALTGDAEMPDGRVASSSSAADPDSADRDSKDRDSADRGSALGGHVATRSATAPTPDDEKD